MFFPLKKIEENCKKTIRLLGRRTSQFKIRYFSREHFQIYNFSIERHKYTETLHPFENIRVLVITFLLKTKDKFGGNL